MFLLSAPAKKGTQAVVRTGYLRAVVTVSAAVVLAILAALALALVTPPKPAEASFPGKNGKMVFSSSTTAG